EIFLAANLTANLDDLQIESPLFQSGPLANRHVRANGSRTTSTSAGADGTVQHRCNSRNGQERHCAQWLGDSYIKTETYWVVIFRDTAKILAGCCRNRRNGCPGDGWRWRDFRSQPTRTGLVRNSTASFRSIVGRRPDRAVE